ncbi:velvet factor [Dissophora ornata]|nr:velvet factor [Dissophora ornata]
MELCDSQARIKIVQQPLHARMCGFGEKDRRPIDPPPIVQLIESEDDQQEDTLYELDDDEENDEEDVEGGDHNGESSSSRAAGRTRSSSIMIATPGQTEPPKLTRILMGAVVVSPILLNNERGEPGWYFSFPDLSIRTEGVYTLKFSLMRFAFFDFDDLGGSHASTIIAEELSQPFTVFSAKKFPGMTESTELSKAFAKQGLKIPIRNDLRVRKTADKD